MFSNLEPHQGYKVPTSSVYDVYKENAMAAGIEYLPQTSFGKIVNSTFPDIKKRSVYVRHHPQRENMYIGLDLKLNNKENVDSTIKVQDLNSPAAQQVLIGNGFILADDNDHQKTMVFFTGELVNGLRITKDVMLNKKTNAVSVTFAGKSVEIGTIPSDCKNISTLWG